MKKCKLIHINDGAAVTLGNGDFHFAEEYRWAGTLIGAYLDRGWQVRQLVPVVTPALLREGNYSFYKSGVTVYMEKDFAPGEEEEPWDPWEESRGSQSSEDEDFCVWDEEDDSEYEDYDWVQECLLEEDEEEPDLDPGPSL